MKIITAYAIVKKKNPKISVMEIYSKAQKKETKLAKDEKWQTVIIKSK